MKKVRLVLIGFLATAALGGTWYGWRAQQRSTFLRAAAPARPDVTGRSPELVGRIAEAERALADGPRRIEALRELSQLYHANGFYPEATQCYQSLIALEPREARWPHRAADIFAGYGQLEEAVPLWRRAVELDPSYLPAGIRLGDALLKLNAFDEAAAAYQAVLSRASNNPYALVGLARVDAQAQRWTQARDRLEKASNESGLTIGADLLVTVYEKLNQRTQAEALRGRTKASGSFFDPSDPWLDEVYEDCYDAYRLSLVAGAVQRAGDATKGLRLLQRAVALSPNTASLHYQLGTTLGAMNDRRASLRSLEKVVQLDPSFSDGWIQLIETHKLMGQRDAADRALTSGLAYNPKSPGLHLERGRRLAADKRYDEAVVHLNRSIELRPEEAEAYVEIAKIYFAQEQLERAGAELERALKAEPANPVALTTLALFTISTGNQAQADRWVEQIRLQPRVKPEQRAQLREMYQQQFGRVPAGL